MNPIPARIALLTLTVGALGACGSGSSSNGGSGDRSSESAAQIVQDVRSSLAGFSSVHLGGTTSSSGKNYTFDLIVVPPRGLAGTISSSGAGSFKLVTTDNGTFYLTPDQQFWSTYAGSLGSSYVQQLAGKCFTTPGSGSQFGSLSTDFGKISDLRHSFDSSVIGTVTKGAERTVNGQQVIPLKASDGTEIDVPAQGAALPVQVSQSSGVTMTLTQWNQAGTISAPTNCVSITQLLQGLAIPTPS